MKLTFRNNKVFYDNIVFVNTGQIGDLTVSSLLFENWDNLPHDKNYYLIIDEDYESIFNDYKGSFNIITYNYKKYKFNLFYKRKFLQKLRSLKPQQCFNMTSARGVLDDEIALLSGAKEIYSTWNSWKTLKKLFSNRMDSYYTKVLFENTENEYEKHIKLLVEYFGIGRQEVRLKNKYTFKVNDKSKRIVGGDYITIAPFASQESRSWQPENFKDLIVRLSGSFKIVILGSSDQANKCNKYFAELKNVFNFCGKTSIAEAAAAMLHSKIYIGNDSGLTHIAFKLGIPTVGITGGHNYGKFFPFEFRELHGKFFYKQMDCFGCEWNCIYDKPYCLTDVTVDDVFDYVGMILKERNPQTTQTSL